MAYVPPAHYTSLGIKNFRGFKSADIRLAPLTFLVGPNSSGKSSLFSAVMLLAQSNFWPPSFRRPAPIWNGSLVDLGSPRDALYRHQPTGIIDIAVGLPAEVRRLEIGKPMRDRNEVLMKCRLSVSSRDPTGRLSFTELVDIKTRERLRLTPERHTDSTRVSFLGRHMKLEMRRDLPLRATVTQQLRGEPPWQRSAWRRILGLWDSWTPYRMAALMQRVSSGRAAPKRWYPLGTPTSAEYPDKVSVFDSIDPATLLSRQEQSAYKGKTRFRRTRGRRRTLASVLNELEIGKDISPFRLSPYHSAVRIHDSITGVLSNLMDVGYGASQVIPVITACLSDTGAPLFVEEPEIHLHPKAQGTIAQLLCDTSRNRQVVIETHSVHMINRARIMVARGTVPPEHVVVHYVARTNRGSYVREIPLTAEGDFAADWPDGFFDERYQDTMTLLRLKSRVQKVDHSN